MPVDFTLFLTSLSIGNCMSIALLKSFCLHTGPFDASAEEIEAVISPFYTVKSNATRRAEKLVGEVNYLIRELELIGECMEHQGSKIEHEMNVRGSLVAVVPGIGPVTVAVIESVLGNMDRFTDENDIVAFAGLDPQRSDSGRHESEEPGISKRGSKMLRTALFQSALSAMKCNQACTVLYERLIARGNHKKAARIAVARKLLLQAGSVTKHGKAFTIPDVYLNEKTGKCTARTENRKNFDAGFHSIRMCRNGNSVRSPNTHQSGHSSLNLQRIAKQMCIWVAALSGRPESSERCI